MTTADARVRSGAAESAAVECAHCGLGVPAGIEIEASGRSFCCSGCHTAWDILHDKGLAHYYALSERRRAPVESSGRGFEEFDHDAFHARYVTRAGECAETDLYLEGIHCASCVWLVERVPLALPGMLRAELDVSRSRVRVGWDPSRATLSSIARLLDTLGYRPHPFRGINAEAMRRAEDRSALVGIGVAGAIAINVMLLAVALYSGWFSGMDAGLQRYFRWLSLIVATPSLVWPGRVFFRSAWAALRARTLHMDVPIALALGAAWTRGLVNTVTDRGHIYFDGVATLVFLLLVGRFLQQRAQRAAADSAELLYSLSPATARVVGEDGVAHEVPVSAHRRIAAGHGPERRACVRRHGEPHAGAACANRAHGRGEQAGEDPPRSRTGRGAARPGRPARGPARGRVRRRRARVGRGDRSAVVGA